MTTPTPPTLKSSSLGLRALTGLAAVLVASPAFAKEPVVFEAGPDWDIILDGQVRPRVFFHSGKDFRGSQSEWREVVTQRSRLGATAEEASGLALRLQLQDVRAWGEETDTLADVSADGFDVHQAYAHLPLFDTLALRIGRQEISLDNERLIGRVDWAQRARTFDAARLTWSTLSGAIRLEGLYAKIQETGQDPEANVPPGRSGDVDLGGLHTSFEILPEHEVSPLYLLHSNQAVDELRHTIGLTGFGQSGGLGYGIEAFYQFGELANESVDAFLAAGNVSYTIDIDPKPQILAFGELLSGGSGSPAGTFDTLYATNHRFYGEMDYFLAIPRDTASLGLIDLGGRLGSGIVPRLRAHVDFHHFRTEDPDAAGEEVLGHEIDVALLWSVHDYVSLRSVYSVFLPGQAMRTVAPQRVAPLPLPGDLEPDHQIFVTLDASF